MTDELLETLDRRTGESMCDALLRAAAARIRMADDIVDAVLDAEYGVACRWAEKYKQLREGDE